MSSLIISRVILTAFLAISLSACSKDSKGSKATVRNKGGQTNQKTAPTLDADAAKAAAAKEGEEKASDDATKKQESAQAQGEASEEAKSEATEKVNESASAGSTITVKPIVPTTKQSTQSTSAVKPVAPVAAKPAAPVAAKPTSTVSTKPATTAAKPVPNKVAATKPADAKPVNKDEVKPAATKPATTTATKPVAVKPEVKPTAKPEVKPVAKPDAVAEAAREASRREIVFKNDADLDKDDTSKENLSSTAYKAIVDQLLSRIDLNNARTAGRVSNNEYFLFARDLKQTYDILPLSLDERLKQDKVCDIDTTKGCLLVEVTKDNKVVASYIATQTAFDEKMGVQTIISLRKDIIMPDAATQKNIEILSRVAGGKTVVFTQAK